MEELINYGNIKIHVPNDSFVIGEVHNILNCQTYPIINISKENPIIFDIGANVGAFSALICQQIPKSTVYAFEPQSELFNLMYKTFKDIPSVHLYNFGLSSENVSAFLYKNSKFPYLGNSVYKVGESYESILLKKSSDILEQLKIKHIDFIKMDVEGSEDKIIEDLINNNITFDTVCLEFHSEKIRRKIDTLLEKNYVLAMAISQVPNNGKVIYISKESVTRLGYDSFSIEREVCG